MNQEAEETGGTGCNRPPAWVLSQLCPSTHLDENFEGALGSEMNGDSGLCCFPLRKGTINSATLMPRRPEGNLWCRM